MRAVVQRVSKASVYVGEQEVSQIGEGLLVFVGITHSDNDEDIEWIAKKIVECKFFPGERGRLERSVVEKGGEILVVSQMTLYGSLKKGRSPSFNDVAPPPISEPLFNKLIERLRNAIGSDRVKTGVFGANMRVMLVNEGPVTFILDSRNRG